MVARYPTRHGALTIGGFAEPSVRLRGWLFGRTLSVVPPCTARSCASSSGRSYDELKSSMTHAMTQVPDRYEEQLRFRASRARHVPATVPRDAVRFAYRRLDEVESVARIGSYSTDLSSGGWVSSKGFDSILGIDPTFDRSAEGWVSLIHPDDRAGMVAYMTDEVLGRKRPFDMQYRIVRADTGDERWVHNRGLLDLDGSGRPLRLYGTIADVTEQQDPGALIRSELRYAAILEGAVEAIVVSDVATRRFHWVNAAACALLGYTRDELLDMTVDDIHFPQDLPAIVGRFQTTADGGTTVARSVPFRRKDDTTLLIDVKGSAAVVDGVASNIAFFSDVTALRAAESGLARAIRERTEVAMALARLEPGRSASETATAICDELRGLPGIDVVGVIHFLDRERAVPLAVGGPDGLPFAAGRPLPAARAAYLYGRAEQGPWAEAWRPRPEDNAYGRDVAQVGIRAIAYAPIHNGEDLLGVVAAGTRDEEYARHLIDQIPAVGEFAAAAGRLLSGQLERGQRDQQVRERVRVALAKGGLRPVYQPIVALATGEPVGYEALTRFADGTPPDQMIADAYSVGLGLELEIACIAAALVGAGALAPDRLLSLNASPHAILHSTELAALLRARASHIVIEITEHAEIHDYEAVRGAIAGFGPRVSLAVDDAGSGFASLRHIVELAPQFLKIDKSLVRHVDRDLMRQAMVAGLSQFAARAGCEVIAEGIEEPAELEMLRQLGVTLGQGFLLGRPALLPTTERPTTLGS